MVDLNMKGRTIKLLKENTGEYLHEPRVGKGFLGGTYKALIIKGKIDKLDCIQTKNVCSSKDTIKRVKIQDTQKKITKKRLISEHIF